MARFLIINTGGTIGMSHSSSGLVPDPELLEKSVNEHPLLANWREHELVWHHWKPLLDSSDLQPTHWYQMAQDVAEHAADVDGILISHGTDTLAYSAAALSFLLSGLSLPVVLTGAMFPINADGTDAIDNLQLALTALQERGEVTVAIDGQIMPGSRTTKSSTRHPGSFTTPNWQQNQWQSLPAIQPLVFERPAGFIQIGVITLYPGAPLDTLEHMLNRSYRALVINAYGNGNSGRNPELERLLIRAKDSDIPVFVRSQCLAGEVDFGLYAAGKIFSDHGALGCGGMPFEAVVAKLTLLCSEFDTSEQITKHFLAPLSREWQ